MWRRFFNNIPSRWIFLVLLLTTAALYNYQSVLLKRPQSTHHWRQADCASLALLYYQNGMKFFEPQTHNLTSDNGTTGFVAPSEVPLMYYFVAVLYKIFGYHDFIYRFLNTLIFLTGMFYLFKLFQLVSRSTYWGMAGALLFFTSPVLAYYGNNFLTNSSSLAFSIIGWYYFFLYREKKISSYFYWSIAVFGLACCMKISSGFSLFALLGLFMAEKLRIIKLAKEPVFPKGIYPWLTFFIALVVPFSWIVYAHHYNTLHATGYFSTGTFPLWTLDASSIARVKHNVWNLWRSQYFSGPVLVFLAGLFLFQSLLFFRNQKFLMLTLLIMLAEAVLYILLQFNTFADHDYYTIDLYIILIFLFLSSLVLVGKLKPGWLNNKIAKIIFAGFVLYNIYYCKEQMRARYEGWWNEYPAYSDFHTIKSYLRHIGIAPLDTIVTIPEYSHFIHYLTNQRGWTRYADEISPRNTEELIRDDSIFMAKCVSNGAKYLLVLDPEKTFGIMPAFKQYGQYPVGTYGRVTVYATLPGYITKPVTAPRVISDMLFDAEKLDEERKHFLSANGEFIAEDVETRTTEQILEGNYAVKLTTAKAFSFTIHLKGVKAGEEFTISVRRKGRGGIIVASGKNPKNFYYTGQEVTNDSITGWDSLHMQFIIPHKLPFGHLTLYLWNDGTDSVYLDNFRITRMERFGRGDGL